jgi:quercetin dioxygenase-like cupin family protein
VWTRRLDSATTVLTPFGDGAAIDVLLEGAPEQLAAIHVTVKGGARMPEHDHGESDALLIPLTGQLILRGNVTEAQLTSGVIAFVAAGERVSVENPTTATASMIVCFAPASFVHALRQLGSTDADE